MKPLPNLNMISTSRPVSYDGGVGSDCIEFIIDGEYQCRNTGHVFRTTTLPIYCFCDRRQPRVLATAQGRCLLFALLRQLSVKGAERLQRCRDAQCKLMLDVEGMMTCTGMGGRKCEWTKKWAARLNGESAFPNGTVDCPLWLTPSQTHDS